MNVFVKSNIYILVIIGISLKWIQWSWLYLDIDYHDLYLKADVLLLAVFEKFSSTCLEYYRLDPCHYFSSPELRKDAMLKMTKTELELYVIRYSYYMYLFIEKKWEEVFLTLLKDTVKQIMNTW